MKEQLTIILVMEKSIDTYITDYYSFLKDHTQCYTDAHSGWTMISTPFYGIFNDAIEIFVKKEGETFLFSDDGQTLEKLDQCGVNIKSQKNKEWINYILLNYNITCQDNELCCEANDKTFIQKKHDLLCAIMEISEMEMKAQKTIAPSQFKEDIRTYFDKNNIIYTPQFTVQGETGLDFTFDFQVAKHKEELIIKAFDSINRQNLTTFLFGWSDVRQKRKEISRKEVRGLAIINDEEGVKEEFITALKNKSSECILWSERNSAENITKISA